MAQIPVNENANESVNSVLNFLHQLKGKGILTGQENLATDVMYWTDLVYDITGKYPALLGEDFSYGENAYRKRANIVKATSDYWRAGGLVTISWHQVNPDTWDGGINEGPFEDSQAPMIQSRFDELLTPGTAIHNKFLTHLDTIAAYLGQLQEQGVVVLWRPYHEMNGGWFWWGAKDNFSDLWKLMYDRFTYHHKLNNLIWVWSPNITRSRESRKIQKYYPGDEYIDIIGIDGYNNLDNWDLNADDSADLDEINSLKPGNPVAITELGTLPNPNWIEEVRPNIVWFLCWWTHIENHTEKQIMDIYDHSYSINCNELPDFSETGKTTFRIPFLVDEMLGKSLIHLENAIQSGLAYNSYPSSTDDSGNLKTVEAGSWVSGFFPGCLWYAYEYSKKDEFKVAAENWTAGIESQQYNNNTHDLGFMIHCSFGNGYRLTQNPDYTPVLIQSAQTLASRFNDNVGCIRSWDWGTWQYPVIIDNMMNLELLTCSARHAGDTSLAIIAKTHANTTLKNHFRENASSYHVVDYNPLSGEVLNKGTYQGYSEESSWARGQAWGLYGYTMMYRETGELAYLDKAEQIADYFISRLPSDYVAYWDFDDPGIPESPRDASASAITASALLELYQYIPEKSSNYLYVAEEIIKNLASPEYFAEPGSNANFLLKHSTGNKPQNSGIDLPQVYADYYFMEALLKYARLSKNVSSVHPGKLFIMEDSGELLLKENLYDFYGIASDPDAIIDLSFTAGITSYLSSEGDLFIIPKEDFYGNSFLNIKIITDSTIIYDEVEIVIQSVNDPPEPANLLIPADQSTLISNKLSFRWEASFDADNDKILYSLNLKSESKDTIIEGIATNSYRMDLEEIFQPGQRIQWTVISEDSSCEVRSDAFTFRMLSSSEVIESKYDPINIYPNPCYDVIWIDAPNQAYHSLEIEVFDLLGNRLLVHSNKGNSICEVNLNQLDNGYYLLRFSMVDSEQNRSQITIRIIKLL